MVGCEVPFPARQWWCSTSQVLARWASLGPSARQLARTVAPGVAPVATRQSIERDKPFPSAECASASENTKATGDPFAPLARLSAPPGQGRLAPPLRENLRPSKGVKRRGIMVSGTRDRPRRTERCVRSGRDDRVPSEERRADAVRRTRREGRAGRGAGSAATRPRTGIRGCGRRERTHGERQRGRGRPARPKGRRDELDQGSPTRRASGPQRGRPPAGRDELGRTAACG